MKKKKLFSFHHSPGSSFSGRMSSSVVVGPFEVVVLLLVGAVLSAVGPSGKLLKTNQNLTEKKHGQTNWG
jgi:hypothetical protein